MDGEVKVRGLDAPKDKNKDDVFVLTGTTFAGETHLTQLTDTKLEADQWVPIANMTTLHERGDSDSVLSTARHNRLLIEAELRAEHQAAARTTMLDLAKALDQANAQRRQLAAQLREQYDTSAELRRNCDHWKAEHDRVVDEEEKRQAQNLVDKALASGNNVFFNMMLEKSREVWQPGVFGTEETRIGADGRPVPGVSGAVEKRIGADGRPYARQEFMAKFGEAEGNRMWNDALPAPGVSAPGMSIDSLLGTSVADNVTIKWVVKLWWQEVLKARERLAQERLEAERRAKEAADKKAVEDAKKAALEKVQKMVEDLKMRLEHQLKVNEEQEKKLKLLEKELQEAREAHAKDIADAKVREDALQEEIERLNGDIAKRRKAFLELQALYDSSADELRKANETFAAERNKLQSTLRNVTSQLQEAMVLAKHMRETALKAKRDAAGSVSPSKFAELISQLEEMRNQLAVVNKDFMQEKESNSWLLRQLDKNKRQLELERQFLPLLRKVRGPVGPKYGTGQDDGAKKREPPQGAPPNGMPVIPPGSSPNTIRESQSLGALGAARGGPLGVSAPMAGKKQSGGFQEDLNRFSSSLGFDIA